MTIKQSFALLGIVLTLLTGTHAIAEDAGLYAAPPPPDSAYVRLLNADVTSDATVLVGGVTLSASAAGLSPYSFVTQGEYDTTLPAGPLSVKVAAQKFYTVVVKPDGTGLLIEDAPVANPVHAGLYFYNASSTPLQLDATVGGKQAAVFKDVAPGAATSREVNPFEVVFAVADASGTGFELPQISMSRQQGVSVVALQSGDKVTAFQVVNSVSAGQ